MWNHENDKRKQKIGSDGKKALRISTTSLHVEKSLRNLLWIRGETDIKFWRVDLVGGGLSNNNNNKNNTVNLWVIGCNNSETVKFYGCRNEFYPNV